MIISKTMMPIIGNVLSKDPSSELEGLLMDEKLSTGVGPEI